MQKTMLRVWYTFLGCALGHFCPCTLLGLYTRNVGISLLVYFSLATEGYKRRRVKVQMPTFFVCG